MNIKELVVSLGFETHTKPLDAVEERLEHIHHALEFVAAAEIVKGLFEISERFSSMGEAIESASMSAGVTAEEFQKLSYAASQNAVGEDELSGSLAKLNKALYEAKHGSETAQKSFAEAGITPEQLQGFGNSKDALYALSDQFARMKDPIAKQALAMDLFGRSGFKMVKMLSQGSQKFDELGEGAEQMGAVLGGRDVEALANLEDSLSGLFLVFKKLAAAIGAAFAPNVIAAVNALKGFIAANRAIIMTDVKKWIDKIAYGLGFIIGVVMETTKRFMAFAAVHPVLVDRIETLIGWLFGIALASGAVMRGFSLLKGAFGDIMGVVKLLSDLFGGFGKIFSAAWEVPLALVGAFQGQLVNIIARLALLVNAWFPAIGAALYNMAAALAVTPVGVFAAALAAVVLSMQALWTVLHGGDIKDSWLGQMLSMLATIPDKLMAVWKWISGAKDAPKSLMDAVTSTVKPGEDSLITKRLKSFAGSVHGDDAEKKGKPDAAHKVDDFLTRFVDSTRPATDPQAMQLVAPDMGPRAAPVNNVSVSAPITVNVPTGMTPKQAEKSVKDAVAEHLDSVHRDAMRGLQTSKAY